MSFNGSGSFLINTAGQPVVSGTVISSTAFNALTADLATGLSTCITKDGQTTVTANLPMAGYKFTGLGTGSAAGDSPNLSQVQSTVVKLLASVSGADTITAVGSPTVAAYAAGQMFYFVAAGTNTGAVTLNIDSLGAKAVTRDGSTALIAGDIQSGEVCVVVYDGTRFQLINAANAFGTLTVTGNTYLATTSGNVGIGVTVPTYKLDVQGASGVGMQIYENSTGNNNRLIITQNGAVSTFNSTFTTGSAQIAWNIGASGEVMRIDSSGNLLVGATSNPGILNKSIVVDSGASSLAGFVMQNDTTGRGSTDGGYLCMAGAEMRLVNAENDAMLFFTNNTERARISSDGRLFISRTNVVAGYASMINLDHSGNTVYGIMLKNTSATASNALTFINNSDAVVGDIVVTTTGTAYNQTSDRRLKDDIAPAADAGAKLDAIEIVSHGWKHAPGERVEYGVIAQDLYAIAPQAVTAGDDGDDVTKAWGVDYSKLVPMLVKEIQSLRARVAALEAE